jgi:hypothetical protein
LICSSRVDRAGLWTCFDRADPCSGHAGLWTCFDHAGRVDLLTDFCFCHAADLLTDFCHAADLLTDLKHFGHRSSLASLECFLASYHSYQHAPIAINLTDAANISPTVYPLDIDISKQFQACT